MSIAEQKKNAEVRIKSAEVKITTKKTKAREEKIALELISPS